MYIDTHAHLTAEHFENDLKEVLSRAKNAGVERIINIGTDFSTSKRCVDLSGEYDSLYATAGLHPEEAVELQDWQGELAKIKELLTFKKVVAVGEIGLDDLWLERLINMGKLEDSKEAVQQAMNIQLEVLKKQLEFALEFNLPVVIHSRESESNLFDLLSSFSRQKGVGVLHSFTGGKDFMTYFLDKDWYVSFNGIVTFKNADNVRELLKIVPLDRILVETDAPFLSPIPYRGERCEPSFVVDAARFIAEYKGLSYAEMEQILGENSYRCFPRLG